MKRLIPFTIIAVSIVCVSAIVFAQLNNKSQQKENATSKDSASSKPNSAKSPKAAGSRIAWKTDLTSALDQAKSENKIVVVDVYTDWCGWCKQMDKVIYADPAIVSLSQEQVFLKLNAEDGGQGEQFAKRMRVRGYPTTIILNSAGERINGISGFIESPQEFIQFVKSARASS